MYRDVHTHNTVLRPKITIAYFLDLKEVMNLNYTVCFIKKNSTH